MGKAREWGKCKDCEVELFSFGKRTLLCVQCRGVFDKFNKELLRYDK